MKVFLSLFISACFSYPTLAQDVWIKNQSDHEVHVFVNILNTGDCILKREGKLHTIKAQDKLEITNVLQDQWVPAFGVDMSYEGKAVLVGSSSCGFANLHQAYEGKINLEYHEGTLLIFNSDSN